MKKLSARRRVAVWYAVSLLLLSGLFVGFLIYMEKKIVAEETGESLTVLTAAAAGEARFDGGELQIEGDMSYSMNGTFVEVCAKDGKVLAGGAPEGYDGEYAFEPGIIRAVRCAGGKFCIYDRAVEGCTDGEVWIRGIAKAGLREVSPQLYSAARLFELFLPVLLIISLAGGWMVTKRAFQPLGRIADTARQIQEGRDLSRRIHLQEGDPSDEIYQTAQVFDQMLDRIQSSFEREQQFTNNASHELRTPVAVIMSESEYALRHLEDEDRESVQEALEAILAQSDRMSRLISRLLFLARVDRGALQISHEQVDVALTAEECVAVQGKEAAEKNIDLSLTAKEGIYVTGDEILLGQMVANLVSNAIKYGKAGGWVRIEVREDADRVTIDVEDNGQGIPAEKQHHIWERFYRADNTRADSYGLGLPIARWIADAHGGAVSVVSEPGKGSTFTVRLPRAQG